jgi:hypothetical protein
MIPWWAILAWNSILLWVGLAAIGYGLLLRRAATIAQPYRLQLAEMGEKYIALCDNPEEKAQIQFYLNNVFNPWITIFVAFVLPLFVIIMAICPTSPYSGSFEFTVMNEEEHNKIWWRFTISVVAANPLFGTIALFEVLIGLAFVLLVAGNAALIRRAVRALLRPHPIRRWMSGVPAH